jgi:hypothetical protein
VVIDTDLNLPNLSRLERDGDIGPGAAESFLRSVAGRPKCDGGAELSACCVETHADSSAHVCRREGKKKSIEGYFALAVRCMALESLCCDNTADDCPDDQILQLVCAQKGLRNIDFLNLPIEDKFIDTLADNCPQLHEILLKGTPPLG